MEIEVKSTGAAPWISMKLQRWRGVSRATVSRYLNNGYVSEEKKESARFFRQKAISCFWQIRRIMRRKNWSICVFSGKIRSMTLFLWERYSPRNIWSWWRSLETLWHRQLPAFIFIIRQQEWKLRNCSLRYCSPARTWKNRSKWDISLWRKLLQDLKQGVWKGSPFSVNRYFFVITPTTFQYLTV